MIDRQASSAGGDLALLDGVRVLKDPEKLTSGAGGLYELLSVANYEQASPAEEGRGSRIRRADPEGILRPICRSALEGQPHVQGICNLW